MISTTTSDPAARRHEVAATAISAPQTVAVYASVHGHAQAVVIGPGLGGPGRPRQHPHSQGR